MIKASKKLKTFVFKQVVNNILKKEINVLIGDRIRRKRKALHLSREDLSEMLGISALFLGYIESGTKGMSLSTLQKVCKTLCVSADYLILGKESAPDIKEIYDLLQNLDEKYIPLASDYVKMLIKTIATVNSEVDRGNED